MIDLRPIGAAIWQPLQLSVHRDAIGASRSVPYSWPLTLATCFALQAIVGFLPTPALAELRVEAYVGDPWGVAQVTFPSGEGVAAFPFGNERFTVTSPDGRILYPVVRDAPLRRVLRQLLEIDRTSSGTILFLFRGDRPLEIQTLSPRLQSQTVRPVVNPRAHRRLFDQWWEQTIRRWQQLVDDAEFPPVVENFVASSLARRLGRELPTSRPRLLSLKDERGDLLGELFASETARLALDRALVAGAEINPLVENGPLPSPMPWFDLARPDGEIEVEPIAAHVPAECFYLRFGNFSNYLWFRDLSKKWEGDLMNMIAQRSIDRGGNERLQQQLSLRESALAKVLGPQVISDVALIGLDPYLGDGAAIGIVLQAQNDVLLFRDLTAQRREALEKFPDAKESTVTIAGREVSLIASPGGEVRSYYVRDDHWHLVSTSSHIVRRFLQAGQGVNSLASSSGFLHVRQRLPLNRDDTLFGYIAPEFFRSLTSPSIWIESQRRLRSLRELTLLQLAQRQARAEGSDAQLPEELIAQNFLPASFGKRADGSRLILDGAEPRDSLRGAPGLLAPIGDVEVPSCSSEEAAAYRRFSDRFRQEIGQLPPLAIAAKRIAIPGADEESMRLEVVATPLEGVKLGKLAQALGPPSEERISSAPEDVIHFEFVLDSLFPLLSGGQELHHLFGALQDSPVPAQIVQGKLSLSNWREQLRGYVGAWPRAGLLATFTAGIALDDDEPVDSGNHLWARQRDDILVVSLRPEIVQKTLPQLQRIPAARPAQAWVDVGTLAGTQLEPLCNAMSYEQSREACRASIRLMDSLQSQLHVPVEECRELAERLVDGTLACPLGGEYQLTQLDEGATLWTSSALTPENRFTLTQTPADYQMPMLQWLHALRGDLQLTEGEISLQVDIVMARSAVP